MNSTRVRTPTLVPVCKHCSNGVNALPPTFPAENYYCPSDSGIISAVAHSYADTHTYHVAGSRLLLNSHSHVVSGILIFHNASSHGKQHQKRNILFGNAVKVLLRVYNKPF